MPANIKRRQSRLFLFKSALSLTVPPYDFLRKKLIVVALLKYFLRLLPEMMVPVAYKMLQENAEFREGAKDNQVGAMVH